MTVFETFLHEFYKLLIEAAPFFAIGVAFGALFESYVHPNLILKYLKRGPLSVFIAAIIGAILPGCACATMPMAESMKNKGGSLGTVSSFILVSPLVGPHTMILAYGLLGLKFTLARIVFSISGAVVLGLGFQYLESKKWISYENDSSVGKSSCEPGCCSPKTEKLPSFTGSLFAISKDLGKYFLLGLVIASTLIAIIPPDFIPRYLGGNSLWSYLFAAFSGIPIYVCEGEEIPLVVSLMNLGLGEGPAFTFMMGAVGTCIPTMVMAKKIIGMKPMVLYAGFWLVFAVGTGYLVSLF